MPPAAPLARPLCQPLTQQMRTASLPGTPSSPWYVQLCTESVTCVRPELCVSPSGLVPAHRSLPAQTEAKCETVQAPWLSWGKRGWSSSRHLGLQGQEQTSKLPPRLGNVWKTRPQGVPGGCVFAGHRSKPQAATPLHPISSSQHRPRQGRAGQPVSASERWSLVFRGRGPRRASRDRSLGPSCGSPRWRDLAEDVEQLSIVRAKVRFSCS